MWRFALSRRWWAGHALVVAGCALFLWLAQWQWQRAQSVIGDWQNLGYALQWPLFALVLVAAWLRFLWLERHRGSTGTSGGELPGHESPGQGVSDVPGEPPAPRVPASHGPAPRSKPEDEPDDELTAYNAYLAQLARLVERDRQR